MSIVPLPSRAVVRVSGPDAKKLLNDTLTARFDEALDGAARWFALLTPQGKVLVEGLVTHAHEAYWFDIHADLVADFLKRMKLYRLRAKVELEPLPDHRVFWADEAPPVPDEVIAYADSRRANMGTRLILPPGATLPELPRLSVGAYDDRRIAAGIAEYGSEFASGEVFPHDVGMDFLGGLDFLKGCYVGQEVVSRMEHRGTARRRPVIVSGVPEEAERGASIMVGEREAGTIGAPRGGHVVGIVRIDRIAEADAATVLGRPVRLALPESAPYRFGESGAGE